MKKYLFAIIGLVTLQGCATEYSCGQFPSSGCQPVSKVNENTNGELYDYREDLYEQNQASKKKTKGVLRVNREAKGNSVLKPADPGEPIIKKPEILRVYMPDWIDAENDLNAGGYMFIKVREADWSRK